MCMSKINLKKRVKTERFQKALLHFLMKTQTVQDILDENGCYKDSGYLDYYLIHANELDREKFEDNVKFCRTVEYISKLGILPQLKKCKTITVKRVLWWSQADIIFKFEFHDEKFKEWQQQVFELLTFQNLSC